MKTKFVLTTYLFLMMTIVLRAQKVSFCDSTGCVGDVKYSIVPPQSFIKHYPGWILLDGEANNEDDSLYKISKLHSLIQIPSLPDARGVFLRGMNIGRDVTTGDADGNRNTGDHQNDNFKHHDHDVSFLGRKGDIVGFHVEAGAGDPTAQRINWGDRIPFNNATSNITIEERGGNETRPRNIALYIYIKIN